MKVVWIRFESSSRDKADTCLRQWPLSGAKPKPAAAAFFIEPMDYVPLTSREAPLLRRAHTIPLNRHCSRTQHVLSVHRYSSMSCSRFTNSSCVKGKGCGVHLVHYRKFRLLQDNIWCELTERSEHFFLLLMYQAVSKISFVDSKCCLFLKNLWSVKYTSTMSAIDRQVTV